MRSDSVSVVVKNGSVRAHFGYGGAVRSAGPSATSAPRARLSGLAAVLISGVIAAALVVGLRMTPSYDPFGWPVWGRQTIHLELNPAGAPSWKPLPWLLTTGLALADGAAPTLWLIIACAAGL